MVLEIQKEVPQKIEGLSKLFLEVFLVNSRMNE